MLYTDVLNIYSFQGTKENGAALFGAVIYLTRV